jgi:hypothetical protein
MIEWTRDHDGIAGRTVPAITARTRFDDEYLVSRNRGWRRHF